MTRFLPLCLALLAASAAAQPTVYDGTLDAQDPTRPGGAYYDAYTFDARENQPVTVRMQSETFDTYLIVRSPSGIESISDDFEGTMISQVDLIAAEAGRWTVWASAYSSTYTGDYTLTIRPGNPGRSRLVQGRLDRQDEQAIKGEYYDTLTFDSRGDGEVIVQLTSLGFYGFLVVTAPDGTVTRISAGGQEQMQTVPMPNQRGEWRVDVTTDAPNMVGAYDVRFTEFDRQ